MVAPTRSLLAAVSLLAVTAAMAQTAPVQRGPATSPPPGDARPGETPLDEITVTQTKTEGRAIDALGGSSVVTREQVRQIQPDRISDTLRQVPGVSTSENHNDPGQAINIRGLQDFGRVAVLVDGARQNFQSTGHGANGTFYLDPELVGGVDITRGPVSTIYGSGAIGGVVAFRTLGIDDILRPDERAGLSQKVGLGTNGYGIVNSSAVGIRLPNNAATVFGQFLYRQNYTYRDGAGILIPDTGSDVVAANFKVNVTPAEGHQIGLTALRQKFDFANNGSSNAGARFRTNLDTDTYTLGYRWTPPDMPLIDLSLKGYYSSTYDVRTFLSDAASGLYRNLGTRAGDQIVVDLATTGFDVFNTSRFDTGPVSHALTYGADGIFDDVRTTDRAGGFTGAFTPTGRRDLTGAFVQDELRYGGWFRAVGALRFDQYELSGNGFRSSGDRISPRGTIGVSPFPWLEFFGTYAEGYRAPAISETLINGTHPFPAFQILPNTALKAETAHTLEGGVNIKFDGVLREGDAFRAKVVGFSNQVDDYIDIQGVGPRTFVAVSPLVPAALCQGRTVAFGPCQIPIQAQQYVNIARADLSGVEVEAAYDWGDGFASLGYSHTDGINAASRIALVRVPPDKIAGTLGLRFLDRALTIGTRIVYNDARSNVPASTLVPNTKEYALVDLFASYDYSDTVRADLTLANVFDKRYVKYLDIDRSPGFQARGGLTVRFATR